MFSSNPRLHIGDMMEVLFKFKEWEAYYGVSRNSETCVSLQGEEYNIFGTGDETSILSTSLPTLYKKTKAGDWQEMKFSVILGTPEGIHLVSSIECPGIKDRIFTSVVKQVPSKPYSFVMQERVKAKWLKKQDRDGWTLDKETKVLGEPILLHHWDQYKGRIEYPAMISPKYNGIRATFKYDANVLPIESQLLSRKRVEFKCPDIEAQLQVLGLSVDGELWAEGKELEDIVSMVAHGDRDLKYMIFDYIDINPDRTYPERLSTVIGKMQGGYFPNLQVVPVAVVRSEEEVSLFSNKIKSMGGVDGAVVRNVKFPYEFNIRSYDVLKVKDLLDSEYVCSNIVYDSDPIGKLAKMEFSCPTVGTTFLYVPDRSKEERAQMYRDFIDNPSTYVGHTYTLYYREKTKRGLPRHVLSMNLREYE